MQILIVDDSQTARAVIRKILRLSKLDIEAVHEAGNGLEALDVLASVDIDLLLADINMPVMNGVELIEQMKVRGFIPGTAVVLVTTEGPTTRIEQLMATGVQGYVRKPITPEQIRDVVSGCEIGGSHAS